MPQLPHNGKLEYVEGRHLSICTLPCQEKSIVDNFIPCPPPPVLCEGQCSSIGVPGSRACKHKASSQYKFYLHIFLKPRHCFLFFFFSLRYFFLTKLYLHINGHSIFAFSFLFAVPSPL